jgi:phospholipid transport system transporter-binding protein
VSTAPASFSFAPEGAGRFAVGGAMTFATAAALHRAGLAAFAAAPDGVIELDCSGVSGADSAGLAVLVDWLAWARRSRRTLRLRGVPSKLVDLARISELDELIAPA